MKIYCITEYGHVRIGEEYGGTSSYDFNDCRRHFFLSKKEAQENLLKCFLEFCGYVDESDDYDEYYENHKKEFLEKYVIIEEDNIHSDCIKIYGDLIKGGVRIDEINII